MADVEHVVALVARRRAVRTERVTSAVETTGRATESVLLHHLDAVSLERAAVTAAAARATAQRHRPPQTQDSQPTSR